MSTSNHAEGPTPALFFQAANAYQCTQALKAAVELDLFTAIGEGKETVPAGPRVTVRGGRTRSANFGGLPVE